MASKIDWKKTDFNARRILEERLVPIHYKGLCDESAVFIEGDPYSEKTNHHEKFRQHFWEHDQPNIIAVPNGYMVLKRWFPRPIVNANRLFLDAIPLQIKGNCIVSYDAGYEQAKREPFMMDHYHDANTPSRKQKRMKAKLAEAHVQNYFATHYSSFYCEPTNYNKYEKPAKDDFRLIIGENTIYVDVKTTSYENEFGLPVSFVRNPKPNVLIIVADWMNDETTLIHGMAGTSWMKATGISINGNYHVPSDKLWNIECLLVFLNMMQRNIKSYRDFYNHIKTKNKATG